MIHCLITDDDQMSIKVLESLISSVKEWKVVGSCSNIMQTRELLKLQKVDVLFLDVEMPDVTGLQFMDSIDYSPEVVIVSSNEKYAIDAFAYNVADYLLKPVSTQRFIKTIDRIEGKLLSNPKEEAPDESIYVRTKSQTIKVAYDDIYWIEACGDYVAIFTKAERLIVHTTLKGIESRLPPQFMRIHRSYIIHLHKINAIEETLIVIGKKLIPTGESYRADLLHRLNFL
jgi:DNA-binding LytR/AlgR family response regulator